MPFHNLISGRALAETNAYDTAARIFIGMGVGIQGSMHRVGVQADRRTQGLREYSGQIIPHLCPLISIHTVLLEAGCMYIFIDRRPHSRTSLKLRGEVRQ